MAKIIFSDLNNKGFSLLELVIIISVLTILSSIGISSYICVQKRAKATTALVAAKQIQQECSSNIEISNSQLVVIVIIVVVFPALVLIVVNSFPGLL